MKKKKLVILAFLALCLLAYLCKGRIGAIYGSYQYNKHIAERMAALNIHDVDFQDSAMCIPTLSINTRDRNGAESIEISSYTRATLSIVDSSCENRIQIKIKKRGNTTSTTPKAPYTLKLSDKQELCGLKRAKKFVLLANSFDRSLMNTSVALEFARELDVPYTPQTTPVNLIIDGQYRGLYDLCEKIDIGASSVDIDKNTEALFVLDIDMKEDFQFYSRVFNLPVGIKESLLDKIDTTDVQTVDLLKNQWIDRFERFENAMQNYIETKEQDSIVDWHSLVDYLLVNFFTRNTDIQHPRSVYIYTTNGGETFHFGPVWDFDLAFGNHWQHFENRTEVGYKFWYGDGGTMGFLKTIFDSQEIKALISERWQWWKENKLSDFWNYFDAHARKLSPYYELNARAWPLIGYPYEDEDYVTMPTDFSAQVEELRQWIIGRIDYMDEMFGTSNLNYPE